MPYPLPLYLPPTLPPLGVRVRDRLSPLVMAKGDLTFGFLSPLVVPVPVPVPQGGKG